MDPCADSRALTLIDLTDNLLGPEGGEALSVCGGVSVDEKKKCKTITKQQPTPTKPINTKKMHALKEIFVLVAIFGCVSSSARNCLDVKESFQQSSCCGAPSPESIEVDFSSTEWTHIGTQLRTLLPAASPPLGDEAVLTQFMVGLDAMLNDSRSMFFTRYVIKTEDDDNERQQSWHSFHFTDNDTTEIRQYFNNQTGDELLYSASAAKSLLGLLVGVAEKDLMRRLWHFPLQKCLPYELYNGSVLERRTLYDLMNHIAGVPDDDDGRSKMGLAFSFLPDEGFIKAMRNQVLFKNGVAKMQAGEDDVRDYNPSTTPGFGYSTNGIHMAGVCLQTILGNYYHANNTMWSQFEFEQWARDRLFSKLPGCENARITGDGTYTRMGSLFYAKDVCYESLLRFMLNHGQIDGEQVMEYSHANSLLQSTNYREDRSHKFFGVQYYPDDGYFYFGGAGWLTVSGTMPDKRIVMTHRKSFTQTLDTQLVNLTTPVIESLLWPEMDFLPYIDGSNDVIGATWESKIGFMLSEWLKDDIVRSIIATLLRWRY